MQDVTTLMKKATFLGGKMNDYIDELIEQLKAKNKLLDAYRSLNETNKRLVQSLKNYIDILKKENEWLKSTMENSM